jgi:hypothetical protein
MVIIFQILFIFFSLFAIVGVIRKRQGGNLGVKGTGFWVIFWIAAILVVLWPRSTQIIANHIGIGRGSDLVLYSAAALMFYLAFKLNVKIEGMNRELTKVVRKVALEEKDIKKY